MKEYCVITPTFGQSLFKKLKEKYGYNTAFQVFNLVTNAKFQEAYKGFLDLDSENVPSFDTIKNLPEILTLIDGKEASTLEKSFKKLDNTIDNYKTLVNDAYQFNKTHNKDFIAIVTPTEDKLQVTIQKRTEQNDLYARQQYQAIQLVSAIEKKFESVGITYESIAQEEIGEGRAGYIDFARASTYMEDGISMIKIANNMQGALAISHEFSHLIVGLHRNDPLVQRIISSLSNDTEILKQILKNSYDSYVSKYNGNLLRVAEEAFTVLLNNELNNTQENIQISAPSLFKRAVDFIKNLFKKISLQETAQLYNEAQAAVSQVARDFWTNPITEEQITAATRNEVFNELTEDLDTLTKIVKEARDIEVKRLSITNIKKSKDKIKDTLKELDNALSKDGNAIDGIIAYSKAALGQLSFINQELARVKDMSTQDIFHILNLAMSYRSSYLPFIKAINTELQKERMEGNIPLNITYEIEGNTVSLEDTLAKIIVQSNNIMGAFEAIARPLFAKYLAPCLGVEGTLTVPFGARKGQQLTIEELLEEAFQDISATDRWLDTMSQSSDLLLQLFNVAIKNIQTEVRLKTIDTSRRIQELMKKADSYEITDFEWMFEKDDAGNKTGNYISEIDNVRYEQDKQNFEEYLNKKYEGKKSLKDIQDKREERKKWREEHIVYDEIRGFIPNPDLYRNSDYIAIMSSPHKKEIYEDFMTLKSTLEDLLPSNKSRYNAIQIRKSASERMMQTLQNPSTLMDALKNKFKEDLLRKADDEQMYGGAMVDFNGDRYGSIPVLYRTKLEDPNELSTDIFGTLMAYSYMAHNYECMNANIDALEVGKTLMSKQFRKVDQSLGDKTISERIATAGYRIDRAAEKTEESNAYLKLKDFLECQVYGRYLKDEGTFDFGDTQVDVNKTVSQLLKYSSLAQLGFNWLANTANILTGVSMQHIEAVGGKKFTRRQLIKADKEYWSLLKDYIKDLKNRSKESKLALFDDLLDVRQNYGTSTRRSEKKSLLERLFGETIAYLGQDAGDHWLYNRTAIAMCMNTKVFIDGVETNLWDALQITTDTITGQKVLTINPNAVFEDGSKVSITKTSLKIANENHALFGVYNDADKIAADRIALGRLLLQYKKWMKPQFDIRFQKTQYSVIDNEWTEGYYRTFARFSAELMRGKFQLGKEWNNLTEEEQTNIKKALFEIAQLIAVIMLADLIKWSDDKNRPWAVKMAEYSAQRLKHELGTLAPSPIFLQENLKVVKNPMPVTGAVDNLFKLGISLAKPWSDWNDEMQSGPYKGHSTLYKNFMKAPIPGISQVRMIDKFLNNLDYSISYYVRNY